MSICARTSARSSPGDSAGSGSPRLKSTEAISPNDSVITDWASVRPPASMKRQLTVIPFATSMLTRWSGAVGPKVKPTGAKLMLERGRMVSGMPENILPLASISFAPVGLTFGQTARLNLVNMDVANGITVSCRFIDAGGLTLAQSVITLSLGKIASVDFKRGDPLPGESPGLLRAEVRAQIDIFTYGVSSDSLRRSLEVFNNDSGATTVFMGGAGL